MQINRKILLMADGLFGMLSFLNER